MHTENRRSSCWVGQARIIRIAEERAAFGGPEPCLGDEDDRVGPPAV